MPTLFRAFIIIVSLVSVSSDSIAQSPDFYRQQAITLKRVIERNHYSPKPVNDSFSARLFESFIKQLDPDNFLTPQHLRNIEPFRYQLDDELEGKIPWKFLVLITENYRQDLNSADSLLAKKITTQLTVDQKKEINALRRSIKRTLNHPSGYNKYVASVFCDALANCFDPHTEYMPIEEKQQFDGELGTEGYYFGLSVDENENGDLAIDRLVPGSPAWKCGELNKGDILIKLAWEGKDTIDLMGADRYELSELLQGSNDMVMSLTIKKADGILKTIPLVKEKMRNEENVVKSMIIKGEPKIGYLYLPDFYYGERGAAGSCAGDVAREIIKLKTQGIAGLILDVRYNGGGSLLEALDMAGIFINEGPLGIIKEKSDKPVTLKDMSRGTIYDGPLAVLVNAQSASASELLAAVLQDYNRAVIIGSTTFGKGTAQIIIPVDTLNRSGAPEYGFVKVTTSKFYRIKGTTTQYTGVVPDIILPDLFDDLNYHEHALPEALTPDTIAANKYYKPLAPLPVSQLSVKSKIRVAANTKFARIKDQVPDEDIYITEASSVLNDLINDQK